MSPTIVIVPGAWHTPIAFEDLVARLSPFFHVVCISLPSTTSPQPARVTLSDDIDYLRNNYLLPLINGGNEVVVLAHSYAAVPASAAVKLLSVDDIAWARGGSGQGGGVVGLIYLSGFLIKEGTTFYEFLNSQQAARSEAWHSMSSDCASVPPPPAGFYLYHSLPPDAVSHWSRHLRPHALHTLGCIVPYAAWSRDEWRSKCVYIATSQDRVNPPSAQSSMISTARIEQVINIHTGHAPFVTDLDECTNAVLAAMQRLGFEARSA
ncbi:MAG: hypothetical protein M1828_005206 [Chrysothrix sp. TS-e1954]|nr:MAG: hypothetical protein M1828_005206 [Chrysothrix sp. TS-e1954]